MICIAEGGNKYLGVLIGGQSYIVVDENGKAIRCTSSRYPEVNVNYPANCNGEITFNGTLDVPAGYEIRTMLISHTSCSMQDDEMAMTIKLELPETIGSWYAEREHKHVLPNSQGNLGLPLFQWQSVDVHPVSLGSLEIDEALDPALVVVYSDGSKKVVVNYNDPSVYKTASNGGTGFDVTEGCDELMPYEESLPDGYTGDTVEGTFYWGNCSMSGGAPQGFIIMEFDDYQASYDASGNVQISDLSTPLADWVITEQ